MASWVKCTDLKAQTVWVNLDNVTVMTWRDTPQDTEIIFIGRSTGTAAYTAASTLATTSASRYFVESENWPLVDISVQQTASQFRSVWSSSRVAHGL
jgi:hypothetical protein